MKFKAQLTIFHKLVITLLLVSLVPLCTLWYLEQSSAQNDLNETISQNLVATMNTTATGINAWDDTNLRALRQTVKLSDVMSMNAERQNPVLAALGTTYEWSYLIHTVGLDGNNVGRNDGKPAAFYGDRAYFKDIMAGKDVSRQVAIGKSSNKPALMLVVPIHNDNREVVGLLAMAMSLTDVSDTVAQTRIGETGRAILLDASNKVIAHGASLKTSGDLQDFSSYPALKAAGIKERPARYTVEGKEMVGLARQLPQGWTLLIEQEYDEAYAPLTKMESRARMLILGAVLLVIVMAFLLGRQLANPIRQLTAVADELSNGNLEVEIPHTMRGDEIGSLARTIARLGISMQMAIERLRKKA
jgi:methyl-accepting chemotaxis protein